MIDNLETTLRHKLRLFRLLDNRLISSDCEIESQITIELTVNPADAQMYLHAMKLWLSDFVDMTIAYDPENTVDTSWIDSLDNGIIMVPGDPLDHIILSVIHSKLRAIGSNVVNVKRTQLFCDTSHGFSNAINGDTTEWLPEMDAWIGPRHFHNQPWWHRDDASTVDIMPAPDDDVSVPVDLGGRIVDMIREDYEEVSVPEAPSAEIIKPVFKPRIVTPDDN